jgi:hypothetical protein
MYKNIQFRSRLEAKWAAFFDLLGWRWEYEPFDLNGWIPDFLLIGKSRPILVEIKPVTELPEEVMEEISISLESSELREKYEILILGVTPLNGPVKVFDEPCIGWLGEWMSRTRHGQKEVIKLWFCAAPWQNWRNGGLGFCHSYGSFYDRITGNYDGNTCGDLDVSLQVLQAMWGRAGDITQWKAPK